MGNHLYKKPEPSTVRGVCVVCNKNPQGSRGKNKDGVKTYRAMCHPCHRKRHEIKKHLGKRTHHQNWKDDTCAECGFVCVHPIQMDIDHIDGNSNNNHPDNIQTLCCRCHRLKTVMNEDWKPNLS